MSSTEPQPQIHIGEVSGSTFAIGSHAEARSYHGTGAAPDQATDDLLTALRELRAELSRAEPTDGSADLDAALADAEDEITRTGSAGEGRLRRLRALLGDAVAVSAVAASAATVAAQLGM
ncbi:hypothetical protein ACMA1D_00215 [Streptomyces sp. 796.1]|uniref:hypothetical protein n=1 Tax=Streptomyces sp. 796.1 TaxID=3163029 RepID=UPI0039C9984D